MKRDSNQILASSLRRMVRLEHRTQVRRIIAKSHPADVASVFPSMTPAERLEVFDQIRDEVSAAAILTEIEPSVLSEMLDRLDDERLTRLILLMASDDGVDILRLLSEDRKDRLITLMSHEQQSEAESLVGYNPETAGGLMSTEVFALDEATTAGDAIRSLQSDSDTAEVVFYLYVVNEHDHLVGVMSLRELVRARKTRPIRELMISEVIRVGVDTDQEEVARLVARYNLLAIPVVDANNRLVGVVTVDDIIDVIRREATEDIMKMAGAGEDISPHKSPYAGVRARLPWLLPSYIAGVFGVFVVSYYFDELLEMIALAALLPMLSGLASNIGRQSAALVTRWIAVGQLEFVQVGKLLARELAVGSVLALVFGGLTGAFVALYFGGQGSATAMEFGLVSAGAVAGSMTIATLLGASAPLLFEKIGRDPAVAGGPFVTTVIDVLAIWGYLFLAAVLLT